MSQALVDIQEKLKRELSGINDSVPAPSGRQISTKGKVFTFPDGKTSTGPLTAVILDHRNFNKYYSAAYNPNEPTPPKCFAISKSIDDMAPHPEVEEPQSEKCESCTFNQWGSAPTGKGKACRNTVRLAIAPIDAKPEDDPFILSVSPTGIKQWASLVNALRTAGMVPIQALTQISFDPNEAFPTLLFKAERPLEDEEVTKMWALREKAQALLDQPPAAGG